MAVDRNRLASALAHEQERRRRMMESVPSTERVAPAPQSRNLRRDLENLSIGVGEGITNQLEGLKGIVTDPVGAVKAGYETVKGVVRDPSVLADALRYTAQKAGSGPLGAGEVIGEMVSPMRGKAPVMQEIDVYHGSPHRFEEFDASKIGTGEGAQVYGHGIYFAENPEVARSYRDNLTSGLAVDKFDAEAPQQYAARLVKQWGSPEKAMDVLTSGGERMPTGRRLEFYNAIKDQSYKDFAGNIPKGSFYTADLPDEMVDRMLDWDKPLKEQSAEIKKTAAMMGVDPDDPEIRGSGLQMELTYRERKKALADIEANPDLSAKMPNYEAIVAERLRQAGIPGIKYRDAGSRGQGGSGTRNFVVFPGEEKKVKILKRE